MPGSVGASSPDRLGAGTLILASCACFLQVLAAWAYFLPWREFEDGLVLEMVSDLLDGSTNRAGLVVWVLVLICFAALMSSLILVVAVLLGRVRGTVPALASSLLNSLAIVGPLMYVQAGLGFESGLDDLRRVVGDLYVGWWLALVCCVAAGIPLLFLHLRTRRAGVAGRELVGVTRPRTSGADGISRAILLMMAVGVVIATFGLSQPWYSGESSGFPHESAPDTRNWSYEGYEVSTIMVSAVVAAIIALAVCAASLTIHGRHRRTTLLLAQDLSIISLALVTFWGLMYMDFEVLGVDVYTRNVDLGVGWYLCVAGQALLLLGAMLLSAVDPAGREHSWHPEGGRAGD